MKLTEINDSLERINGKDKKALLEAIDLKVAEDLKVFQAEIKGLAFKFNILSWALVVIVIGFLGKILWGA